MIKTHQRNVFSFFFVPFCVLVFLFGIFVIVWLRSGVRTVEYSISMLDNQRKEILKERKLLMAEKASLLSIQNIKSRSDGKLSMVFPDRMQVIYVKKDSLGTPHTASYEGRHLSEP